MPATSDCAPSIVAGTAVYAGYHCLSKGFGPSLPVRWLPNPMEPDWETLQPGPPHSTPILAVTGKSRPSAPARVVTTFSFAYAEEIFMQTMLR